MKKYIISIVAWLLIFVSVTNAFTANQILEKYQSSFDWMYSVSMQIDVKSEILEWPDANKLDFNVKFHLIYRRDGNNFEWNGEAQEYDANGKLLEHSDAKIQNIFANGKYFSISPRQRNKIPQDALITKDSNPYYQSRLGNLQGIEEYGGTLFGRTNVNNNYSINDLLSSDTKMIMRPQMESVRGVLCYVLEATTKYGHVTAWIAPDKAYNAMKWMVIKGPNDLVGDKPAGPKVEKGTYELEVSEFQEINGVMIPKNASYISTIKISGAGSNVGRETYRVSQVSLNPDFKELKAFEPNVPEGTRVHLLDTPGILYVWQNGRAVVDVNKSTFEDIDKTIDQFKQKQ
jgi:hypothetical protein